MADLDLRALLDSRAGGSFDLHAKTVNPQFVRLLRTIGFDRSWSRAEGAYFFDDRGERYLDMLGAFRWGIEFDWAGEYLSSRRVDVRPLLSGQFPLQDAVKAFAMAKDKTQSTKVQVVAA